MVAELLFEALNLMVIGMIAVFAFLLLLVLVVQFISVLMLRYFPQKPTDKPALTETSVSGPGPAVIAAISAAVHQYRQQQ
ncbi:OadG family transporter subunit [Rheinheimera gaetbuli]